MSTNFGKSREVDGCKSRGRGGCDGNKLYKILKALRNEKKKKYGKINVNQYIL